MTQYGCPHRDICDAYAGTSYRGPGGVFRSDLEQLCDKVDRSVLESEDICPLYHELSRSKAAAKRLLYHDGPPNGP